MILRPGEAQWRGYRLRLTLGGLFALSQQLDAKSPTALANTLRRPDPKTLRILLDVMTDGACAASDSDLAHALPAIAVVFETSLGVT